MRVPSASTGMRSLSSRVFLALLPFVALSSSGKAHALDTTRNSAEEEIANQQDELANSPERRAHVRGSEHRTLQGDGFDYGGATNPPEVKMYSTTPHVLASLSSIFSAVSRSIGGDEESDRTDELESFASSIFADGNPAFSYVYESTNIPSNAPSSKRTQHPTESPKIVQPSSVSSPPTGVPTGSPSITTTTAPIGSSSATPTAGPSPMPTVNDDLISMEITNPPIAAQPSHISTASPSDVPTHTPTATRTAPPSHLPTNTPSIDDSLVSNEITSSPVSTPKSDVPSSAPTSDPTSELAQTPIFDQTDDPTHTPSLKPTSEPTPSPTDVCDPPCPQDKVCRGKAYGCKPKCKSKKKCFDGDVCRSDGYCDKCKACKDFKKKQCCSIDLEICREVVPAEKIDKCFDKCQYDDDCSGVVPAADDICLLDGGCSKPRTKKTNKSKDVRDEVEPDTAGRRRLEGEEYPPRPRQTRSRSSILRDRRTPKRRRLYSHNL